MEHMKLLTLCVFLVYKFPHFSIFGFNIDIKAPFFKSEQQNTQFGFSILGYSHKSGRRGILVGSPKVAENGGLFWCPITREKCELIQMDLALNERTHSELKDALLGYSLSSPFNNFSGPVTVCAPRLSWYSAAMLYLPGGCFELDDRLENPTLNPSTVTTCLNIPGSDKSIDLRYCTFGASVGHHPKVPKQLYFGGPHFYFEKGVGIILNTETYESLNTYYDDLPANSLLGSALDLTDKLFPTQTYQNGSNIYVAFGAPGVPITTMQLNNLGTGAVVIYHNDKPFNKSNLMPVLKIAGHQFGSRFGQSLIFLDVDGDDLDDLIVGAPYQHTEATEGGMRIYGAVFVLFNRQSRFPEAVTHKNSEKIFSSNRDDSYQIILPPKNICGSSTISGFGTTIAKLGDINHDGYQDFAVGAPYEQNGGAVFIYHGNKNGKIHEPTQVICASDLKTPSAMKGFGFAIGLKGFDIDQNGYPDVAIGATLSSSVAVLRTRPVIKFQAHLVMKNGEKLLPADLNTLPDCTFETQSILSFKSSTVRCADLKLLLTYNNVYGEKCEPSNKYRVSVLLKYNPSTNWLTEGWNDIGSKSFSRKEYQYFDSSKCSKHGIVISDSTMNDYFKKHSVSPLTFINEQSVIDSENEAKLFFKRNTSAWVFGLDSPGGYLRLETNAICNTLDTTDDNADYKFSKKDLQAAQSFRVAFQDVQMLDPTIPIRLGIKWIAQMPQPNELTKRIDDFPIADPRENSQLIELPFDNLCKPSACCTSILIEYFVDVKSDKHGPVVYVGDDKTQEIKIKVKVNNYGPDPIYIAGLASSFPPTILELDTKANESRLVKPNVAICHLNAPIHQHEVAECTIRWLVVGHHLNVKLAKFQINSTVLINSNQYITVRGNVTHKLEVNIKMVVNITLFPSIDPNAVYFTGNVSDGISSITAENQIGSVRLVVKFLIENEMKHSLIPASRLVIDWPYELTGLIADPHGKYILYLLELPYVIQHSSLITDRKMDNTTSITCDSRALAKLVNPHKYRVFSSLRKSKYGVPVRTAPIDLPAKHPSSYPPLTEVMKIEDLPNNDGKPENKNKKSISLSCYNGHVRCVPITCDLGKLSHKAGPILIEFEARLWDNTMREEFRDILLTKLYINATWRADVEYNIDFGDSDHTKTKIEMYIFNNLEPRPIKPKHMNLYIGLAVFGGCLLLSTLVIILQKVGFFERRRFLRKRTRNLPTNTDASGQNRHVNDQQQRQALIQGERFDDDIITPREPLRNEFRNEAIDQRYSYDMTSIHRRHTDRNSTDYYPNF